MFKKKLKHTSKAKIKNLKKIVTVAAPLCTVIIVLSFVALWSPAKQSPVNNLNQAKETPITVDSSGNVDGSGSLWNQDNDKLNEFAKNQPNANIDDPKQEEFNKSVDPKKVQEKQNCEEKANKAIEEYLKLCEEETRNSAAQLEIPSNDSLAIATTANDNTVYLNNVSQIQSIILNGYSGSPCRTVDVFGDLNVDHPLCFKNCDLKINLHSHLINGKRFGDDTSRPDDGDLIRLWDNSKVYIDGNSRDISYNLKGYTGDDYDEEGTFTVKGSALCHGKTNLHGGAISVSGNGSYLTLNKVNIFGCAADDNGGAICFQKGKCNNTIKMINSSIERCLSIDHGAAVANNTDADNNTVIFRKAEQDSYNCGMLYNVSNRYGGAAFTEGKAFSLIGDAKINEYGNADDRSVACISNNLCDRSGGMIEIQCKHSNVLIKGFNIDGNRALGQGAYNGDGGAVDHCNGKVTMVDCNFRNNHGHGDGGAIYMGEDGTLQNCCVKNNTADGEGGGVYVAGDDTLSLGDYVYVYDNHGTDEATDLHLSGRIFRNSYLDGNVNIGSWIGISTSALRSIGTLSEVSVSLDEDCFFCTQSYQHVEAQKVSPGGQPGKYTGRIFLRSGKETKTRTNIKIDEVNASYEATDKTYNDQSIYKGTTQFHTQNHEDEALGTYYYYSDGYFADPEEKYNEHLATCSLALASSSGPTVRDEQGIRDYTKQYTYAYQFLESIGCSRENIAFNESYRSKPTTDSIGVICGSKEIKVNNDTRTLIPVAIRGLDYEQEWISNFNLGTEGDAAGFSKAGHDVEQFVIDYIKNHNLSEQFDNGKVTFWIVGHSRAGATSMLAAKYLTDKYAKLGNSVRAYTFEAPLAGVEENIVKESYTYNGKYCNIHNVINKEDIVPRVAPAELGFIRYGTAHYVPGTDDEAEMIQTNEYSDNGPLETKWWDENCDYSKKYKEFRKAFASTNPYIKPSNYFYSCTIEYFTFGLHLSALYQTDGNLYDSTTFSDELVNTLTELELKDRKTYCSPKVIGGTTYASPQEALAFFVGQVMGKPASESSQFASALVNSIMENNGIFPLYSRLRNFNSWDEEEKAKSLKSFVDNCMKNCDDCMCITKYFKGAELEQFKKCFPTLAYILLDFCSYDYRHPRWDTHENPLLASLMHNVSNIMVTHYPEACLGWLKVYDSYYKDSGNLDKNAFHLKTSEPGDTFAEVDGKEYKTDDIIPVSGKDFSIALKTHSNDGLILYNIGNNADIPNPTFESSKVYSSKIPVDFSSSPLICIKAVNYVNGKYGNVSTFYFGKGACNITVQNVENGQQKESTSSSFWGSKCNVKTDSTIKDEKGEVKAAFYGWAILDGKTHQDITAKITGKQSIELNSDFNFDIPEVDNLIVKALYDDKTFVKVEVNYYSNNWETTDYLYVAAGRKISVSSEDEFWYKPECCVKKHDGWKVYDASTHEDITFSFLGCDAHGLPCNFTFTVPTGRNIIVNAIVVSK